jgi:hypothetical protein
VDQIFGFISRVKPKVSKLLRRHLNGESDVREDIEAPIMRDPFLEWERRKHKVHKNQLLLSSGGLQARARWLGLPRPRFCSVPDPVKSKPCGEEDPSTV